MWIRGFSGVTDSPDRKRLPPRTVKYYSIIRNKNNPAGIISAILLPALQRGGAVKWIPKFISSVFSNQIICLPND